MFSLWRVTGTSLHRWLVAACLVGLSLGAPDTSEADWRTADRSSAGLAPLPEEVSEAIVQVYVARAFKWRGYFSVHSWIAVKEQDAPAYTSYHGIGFRLRRTGSIVVIQEEAPDRRWFGAEPTIITELRGEAAARAIPQIHAAAKEYPYADMYRAWPGPNSNTFVSYLIRGTPDLGVELPPHAIGKDWVNQGLYLGLSETGTGLQFSLFGLLGMTVGAAEGIEVHLLGLAFGLDILRPAVKLPLIGRLGFRDAPVFWQRRALEREVDEGSEVSAAERSSSP